MYIDISTYMYILYILDILISTHAHPLKVTLKDVYILSRPIHVFLFIFLLPTTGSYNSSTAPHCSTHWHAWQYRKSHIPTIPGSSLIDVLATCHQVLSQRAHTIFQILEVDAQCLVASILMQKPSIHKMI